MTIDLKIRTICLSAMLLLPLSIYGADDLFAQIPGLWGAEKIFGSTEPYSITINLNEDAPYAYVLGQSVKITNPINGQKNKLAFSLPGNLGRFEGSLNRNSNRIEGHWVSHPSTVLYSRYATPVSLSPSATNTWIGEIHPVPESFSLYFLIEPGESETLNVRLRNPDRNQGVFTRVASIRLDETTLLFNSPDDETLLTGVYDAATDSILLAFPGRGGTYELTRRQRDEAPGYYPAPELTRYEYRKPLNTGDGWSTDNGRSVDLAEPGLQSLVQSILDTKTDSLITPYIHSILVARHGKLVLEEYFYGYHPDRVHDLRSASKTITALLTGQAIDSVAGFGLDSPIYESFGKPVAQDQHAPYRRSMNVSHLLSMTSGFACDDNDDDSPGNENTMQDQSDQQDWWEYMLSLPLVAEPGTSGVYCSGAINLLGGLVSKQQGLSLQTLFARGLAGPLSINRYHMNLDPLGRGYGGGGMFMRPRDFLKIGQVIVDKGRWHDQQVVSEQWIKQMLQSHASIYADDDYGYGIWTGYLPYRGKQVPIYSATGNGGQLLIMIPSLELVVGFTGGNYGDFRTWIQWREQLVPEYILGAIEASE